MNEERDCVVLLTETNRNNEVVVGLGLFMWIRTERRPLDPGRLLCTLRLSLWDLTSFPSWNTQDVLRIFPLPKCGKRNEKNKRQGSAGAPVSLLWNYLRMLMSFADACFLANGQSE